MWFARRLARLLAGYRIIVLAPVALVVWAISQARLHPLALKK